MLNMRFFMVLTMLLLSSWQSVSAESHTHMMEQMEPQQHGMDDDRISLGLPPMMKQHQLANMRAHLKAIQNIVGLIAASEFEQASVIAHQQLGLTNRMKKMCEMIGNEQFTDLGLAFHQSGDELGEVLLTRNAEQSLQALNKTMGYCVQCHATFRQ